MNNEMSFRKITGEIRLITGLHIGVGNDEIHIGGIDSAVIKDPDGNPYIPGSSLKGKMRALLELSEGATTGKPSTRNDYGDSLIPVIFGDIPRGNEANYVTRILVRDSFLSEKSKKRLQDESLLPTEEKSENSIDRLRGVALSPRSIERAIPGLIFDFEIILRVFKEDIEADFLKLLCKGFSLIEHDSLGGSGSRGYGRVVFENILCDGEPLNL